MNNNDALKKLDGLELLFQGEFYGSISHSKIVSFQRLSSFSGLGSVSEMLTSKTIQDSKVFWVSRPGIMELSQLNRTLRLVTIDELITLEHVGDVTITRNPLLGVHRTYVIFVHLGTSSFEVTVLSVSKVWDSILTMMSNEPTMLWFPRPHVLSMCLTKPSMRFEHTGVVCLSRIIGGIKFVVRPVHQVVKATWLVITRTRNVRVCT